MSDNRAEIYLGVRNEGLRKGLNEAKKWVADFRSEVGSGFASALAAGGIIAAISNVMEYAKEVRNLSDAFAVSTTTLQEWHGALGGDIEDIAGMFNDLTIAKSEALAGDDTMLENFAKLGVSAEELASMEVDEIMMAIGRGMMDAASMGAVMGEEAVRLRPKLKALADGSLELGAAMQDGTVRGLAAAADEMAKARQEFTTGWGEVVILVYKATRSVLAFGTGLAAVGGMIQQGIMNATPAMLAGAYDVAKQQMAHALGEAKIQAEAFAQEIGETWSKAEASSDRPSSIGSGSRQQSEKAAQQLEREASLLERLQDLRRQVAMEQANDQEKLEQLLDRERELRLELVGLQQGSAEYIEAEIAAEEAGLAVLKQQDAIEEKARQARDKEAQERKAAQERRERDLEQAREGLRDEQTRLAVLQQQQWHGEEAAQRTSEQLEYQDKIAQLEDKITKARAAGHAELVNQLTQTKLLVQEQQKLASDPASRAFEKFGRAPRASELRRISRERGQREAAEERFRGRLVDGVIPTKRDINGNVIEGLDPESGGRRRVTPPRPRVDPFSKPDPRGNKPGELMGPAWPGADVKKQGGQQQDPAVSELVEIKAALKKIEQKLDKPLTH